ncbi:restriction endonuclease subunit S [Seongchinamella unica]|nr:restriction endonuclease subunit S [Seongchinamella unica]
MEKSVLPSGWGQCSLADVAQLQNGFAFKSGDYVEWGHFLIRIGNVQDDGIDLSKPAYVDLADVKAKKFELNEGDILMSLTGNIGRVAVIKKEHLPAALNQRVARISPKHGDSLNREFLIHLLRSPAFFDQLTAAAKGAAQQNISGKDVLAAVISLPPLAEQTRIANKLDELLAQVDTIKARVDAIPDILKRFRQSVLAAAVSGKLTGSDYSKWINSKLGDVVEIDIGHAFKSKEFVSEGVPLLRGQNIEPGALRWLDTKCYPDAKLREFRHLFIEEGDIILAMDRPIVSAGLKLARARATDLPCVLVQRVARFKSFDAITPNYLYLVLQDISFSNYLVPNQTGSDIPHISGKQILGYEIAYPSLTEQKEIVHQATGLLQICSQLELAVEEARSKVEEMTQSILAKAFRGELVTQSTDDEAASVFLKRTGTKKTTTEE